MNGLIDRVRINSFLDYDLVITYERSTTEPGRISGHLFEAFDYWLHLTSYTNKKIAIVIPDDINPKLVQLAYEDKYLHPKRDNVGFSFEIIPIVIDSFFSNLACKNILHCSGLSQIDACHYFGKVISFRCGLPPKEDTKYTLLQDTRVYSDVPDSIDITTIHYVKKIPFEFYRRFKEKSEKIENKILIYDNTLMRTLSTKQKEKYKNSNKDSNFLVVGSDIKLPMKDFMLNFNKYWYTPTTRAFDCSSRLIAECAFFNKEVIYKVPKGYMELDQGLFIRRHDIMTNFQSIVLANGDPIQNFIFDEIKNDKGLQNATRE